MTAKTVIITGAGSGIGLASTRAFVNTGANVVMNGRTEEKLVRAAAKIDRAAQLKIVAADVTQRDAPACLVDAAVRRFGRVDVLVNNAGVFQSKPFLEYSAAELDQYLAYLRGTFVVTQAVVRQMRRQGGGGSVVTIGTILTDHGIHQIPATAPIVSKGGIAALTKGLAIELAADDIRVNTVAPGIVPTPLYGELTNEQRRALHARQPLGRYGTPEDIAEAVVFLAGARWITGVVLPVDGGVAAGGDGSYHGSATAMEEATV